MERTAQDTLIATTQSGLPAFDLYRPETFEALSEALAEAASPVTFYAGGTDIFAAFREGLRPVSLIWLDRLEGRTRISAEDDRLILGAGLTHDAACTARELDKVPGLRAGWEMVATARIRRHATLGGNLMARRARYELSILFAALDARAVLIDRHGRREVPIDGIWTLDPEIPCLLESVAIPLAGQPRLDYARDLRPLMTQALALRETGATLAVATQWVPPWVTEAPPDRTPEAVFAALPDSFETPETSRGWVTAAGAALLGRQRDRIGAVA